ncbi:LysM peptidoglycan-binding domain-containing protein [Paenibacillus segetis]|uniref:Stage VI sporulation protein D n=1 Tax=Paenibacillus segetis TaxID=1325360 RepID=A0ABQ1YQU8_9BACL|nr:LysM peptidoglycan-binding domain-containing protein [Paenibacillus segetis]GGH33569.1 stage VI sporulation protein D [Paenibacillus segetis]
MVDQSYGLRFDIYERVHLSDDVIGIEELEEIELYPKIQVIPGEEYAALRGHLLLSGLYRGEGETRELEHWIPVEITIPLSRVNRLEDIAVEIENFDIDLLSARSLNITGVLSLQGIETSSLVTETQDWGGREFVAAHDTVPENRNDQDSAEFTEESSEDRDPDEQAEVLSWTEDSSALLSPTLWADKEYDTSELVEVTAVPEYAQESGSNVWFKQEVFSPVETTPRVNDSAEATEVAEISEAELSSVDMETEDVVPVDAEVDLEVSEDVHADLEAVAVLQQEEKKEMKIALGSKKNSEAEQENSFGITKFLPSKRIVEEVNTVPEKVEEQSESTTEPRDTEEVYWKNLFIGNVDEKTPFRKVKLVIVQREETLDDIAQRYHLSLRELQLYNRLPEQNLSEGQVLYIP